MTQDLYYYESGYIDSSYFVYTADAESIQTATTSISCDAGVIKDAAVALTVTTEITATISHINGADLFAMSNADLAAEVARIRDNNIDASSAFSIATDASRIRYYSSDESADFTIAIDNLRVRYEEAALTAAFSLNCSAEVIIGGETVTGSGSWNSQATQTLDAVVTKELISTQSVTSELTAIISHIEGADIIIENFASQTVTAEVTRELDSTINSEFAQTISAERIRDVNSSLSSSATIDINYTRIVQGESNNNSLFTPNIVCSVTVNSFAVLDSVSTVVVSAIATKQISSSLSNQFSLTTTVSKFTEFFTVTVQDVADANNEYYSVPRGLYVDTSGNMYTTGSMGYATNIFGYASLTKVNRLGEHQWTKTFVPASSYNQFNNVVTDASDNLYTCTDFNNIVKYDSSGSVVWRYNVTSSGNTIRLNQISLDSSNNVIAVGSILISGNEYPYAVKINSSGTYQWNRRLANGLRFQTVTCDGGNIYAAGRSVLVKIDSTGAHVWTRNISSGGSSALAINKITKDSSGNIYCATRLDSGTLSFVVAFNSSGTKLWHRDYGSDVINDLYIDSNNLYCLFSNTISNLDISNGVIVWQKTYNPGTSLSGSSNTITVKNSGLYFSGTLVNNVNPYRYYNLTARVPTDGSGIPTLGTYTQGSVTDVTSSTVTTTTTAATVSNITGTTLATNTFTLGTKTPTATFYNIDPGAYTYYGSASLSSTASLAGSISLIKQLESSASSQFALSANPAGFTREASANLVSEGFVVASFIRIKPLVSLEDTEFNLSADITGTKQLSSSLTSTASQTTIVTKQLGAITSDLQSTTSLTATGVKTTEIILSADNFANMQTTAVKTAQVTASASSEFSQTAQIDAGKIAEADLNAEFSQSTLVTKQIGAITGNLETSVILTADAKVIAGVAITLEAVTSELVSIGRIRPFVSLEDTKFDLSASSVITATAQSQVSSQTSLALVPTKQIGAITSSMATTVSLSADADVRAGGYIGMPTTSQIVTTAQVIAGAGSTISSNFALTAIARETSDIASDIASQFAQETTVVKTARGIVTVEVQASLTAEPKITRRGISLEFSFADMDVDADVIRALSSELSSETATQVTGTKIAGISAALSASGFQITIGRVIDLTNAVKWTVPRESRNRVVSRSNQSWTIKPENRTYKF